MAKKKIEIKGRWAGYTPSGGSRIEDQEEALRRMRIEDQEETMRRLRRATCLECGHEQPSVGPCKSCGFITISNFNFERRGG